MTRSLAHLLCSLPRIVLGARGRRRARALGLAAGRSFSRAAKPTPDYRHIVELANEGVWLIDADSRTTFMNPRMAAMLGYAAAEELVGRSMFDFMDEEWRQRAQLNVERRQHAVTETHEFKFLRKDGSALWTLLAATPFFREGRYAGALGMVIDIGERKGAEDALRESEERYRLLFETSLDALLVVDEAGRFVEVNPQACALTGYSREEFLGMGLAELTGPELPGGGPGLFAELQRQGSLRGEYRIRRKDGQVLEVDFTATRVGAHRYQGALRDISEQKRDRAQRDRLLHQVQLYAAELDATISAIPAGVVILDAAGGVARTNAAARSMLRAHLDDEAIARGPLASSRREALAGEVVTGKVVELEAGSEAPLSVSVAAAPICDGEGGVVGAVMILTDITSQRRLQQQQEEQLHTISHDLRVPLSVMMVQARLVERLGRSREDAQLARLSGSIVNAGRQLNGLIQDLVESTRV
ncbi:MAG: PAS domain-containing protein, partial [Myxococcaceae bacterium]